MNLKSLDEPLLNFRVADDLYNRRKKEQSFNRKVLIKNFNFPYIVLPFLRTYIIQIIPKSILKILFKKINSYDKDRSYS